MRAAAESIEWASGLSFLQLRLPQLYSVPFRIDDPGEAAIFIILLMQINLDTCGFQLAKKPIEIVDSIMNHRMLRLGAKSLRIGWKQSPYRFPDRLGRVFFTPLEIDARIGR